MYDEELHKFSLVFTSTLVMTLSLLKRNSQLNMDHWERMHCHSSDSGETQALSSSELSGLHPIHLDRQDGATDGMPIVQTEMIISIELLNFKVHLCHI